MAHVIASSQARASEIYSHGSGIVDHVRVLHVHSIHQRILRRIRQSASRYTQRYTLVKRYTFVFRLHPTECLPFVHTDKAAGMSHMRTLSIDTEYLICPTSIEVCH